MKDSVGLADRANLPLCKQAVIEYMIKNVV